MKSSNLIIFLLSFSALTAAMEQEPKRSGSQKRIITVINALNQGVMAQVHVAEETSSGSNDKPLIPSGARSALYRGTPSATSDHPSPRLRRAGKQEAKPIAQQWIPQTTNSQLHLADRGKQDSKHRLVVTDTNQEKTIGHVDFSPPQPHKAFAVHEDGVKEVAIKRPVRKRSPTCPP